jgi:hypothetical protein
MCEYSAADGIVVDYHLGRFAVGGFGLAMVGPPG